MIKPLAPGGELAEERTIIFCNTKRDTQGVGDTCGRRLQGGGHRRPLPAGGEHKVR